MILFILVIFIIIIFGYLYLFYRFKLLEDDFSDLYDTVYKQLLHDFNLKDSDF